MNEDRFQNYINQIVPGISCEQYLEDNKKILESIKNNQKYKQEFELYNALGNELRFFIYKILETKPMCTCALARIFKKPDSSITYHLKILQDADLIIGKKKGYFTIYYTKKVLLNDLAKR
jgi:DNA-binding transcriptional ArsR family regulator